MKNKLNICLIGDKDKLSEYIDGLIDLGHSVEIKTNKDNLEDYDIIQLHDIYQVEGLKEFLFVVDDNPILTKEEYDDCFNKSDLILINNQIEPNYFKLGYKTFNLEPFNDKKNKFLRLEEIYYFYNNINLSKSS